MNILLLNHYAGSGKYGMDYRPYCFAREWVKAGHAVRIVAASFSHLRQRQPAITGVITREEIDGIQYLWIKTPAYAGNYLRRAMNIFVFLFRLMVYRRAIVKDFTPDVVIGASTYPLDNVVVHSIAHRCRARHVYEVHDLWPLSLTDIGGMSPRHPFVVLMTWAERYAYRKADAVISTLPYAESHMLERGLGRNKFFCIPNGVDAASPAAEEPPLPWLHAAVLGELRARKKFIVGYAGGHAVSNALFCFVAAAAHLAQSDAAFVLVGTGAEKENLQALAEMLDLANVLFLPPVPRTAVPALLSGMDVLYLGWQNKPIYRFGVSPTKLMDYMLAGKPILHANCAGNDIVADCGCGISVAPENSEAIARAVSAFMGMEERERTEMGRRGRAFILEHLQNKDLAKKVIEVCAVLDAAD